MRSRKNVAVTVFAVLAMAFTVTFVSLGNQGQNKPKKSTKVELRPQGEDATAIEQLPVADYDAPKPTKQKRKAKNERHNKKFPMAIDVSGDNLPANSTAHWWTGLSALPTNKSDAVVIGEVQDAEAFLSSENTGLYSEFTIRITEVLKNDAANPLTNLVVAERTGGAVKFRNGRIKQFRYSGQGFPRRGKQYVFFLQRNADGQDYTILTGYELRGGRVFPLDGAGKKLQFSTYAGTDENVFLNEVRSAIAQGSQASLQGEVQ